MGLNDAFLIDTTAETPAPKTIVNALKDTVPGQMPEEKENVTLIAVETEEDGTHTEIDSMGIATEELQIQLRDLDLLHSTLLRSRGMNQAIALECQNILPDFISDVRPMGSFTGTTTKVHYQAALEEVDEARKGIVARITEFIKNLYKRLAEWIKKALGLNTPSNNKKAIENLSKQLQSNDGPNIEKVINIARKEPDIPEAKPLKIFSSHSDILAYMEDRPLPSTGELANVDVDQVITAARKALLVRLDKLPDEKLGYIAVFGQSKNASVIDSFLNVIKYIESDEFVTSHEKDEKFQEAQSAYDELMKAVSSAILNRDVVLTDFVDTLLRKKTTLFGRSEDGRAKEIIQFRQTGRRPPEEVSFSVIQAMANVTDAEHCKIISDHSKLSVTIILEVLKLVKAYDTFYIEFWKVNGEDSKVGTEDYSEDQEEVYQGPGDGVSPNGAITPLANYTPGGFAEYFYSIKGAEGLHQTITEGGGLNVSAKQVLIARIKTLQEALARIEAQEQPSMESIDLVASSLLPKKALDFVSSANQGNIDKELFKTALRSDAALLTTSFKSRIDNLEKNMLNVGATLEEAKKFGIFSSKSQQREVTPEMVALWNSLTEPFHTSVLAWAGMSENQKYASTFLKEATRLTKQDVFVPKQWWTQFKVALDLSNEYYGHLNAERIEDVDIAGKIVVSGIFGKIPNFFMDAEKSYKDLDYCFRVIYTFIETQLKHYIAVAEKNDYQSDLAYFNDVLKAIEHIGQTVSFMAGVCYVYYTSKKKFLSAAQ